MATVVMKPEGRGIGGPLASANFWAPGQFHHLIGERVVIRDWYATFPATIEAVKTSDRSGAVTHLTLTYLSSGGEVTRDFSLNATREIAYDLGSANQTG